MARCLVLLLATLLALDALAGGRPEPPETASTAREAIDRARAVVQHVAGARRLILLGELHGTREVPALVASIASEDARAGPVVVAVEIDHAEQRAIDAYLRSDGSPSARRALRERPYWARADVGHDGRRNDDLLDLFDHLRRLRRAGRDVAVLAFDVPATPDHHARDRAMATVLRAAYRALPRGRLLVVTGNVRAMKVRPPGAPPIMQVPAGAYLHDLDPVSIRITARAGHFWVCREACGPAPADGAGQRTGPSRGAYDHVVVLPRHHVARLIGAPASR
jgi:hypothetical protein